MAILEPQPGATIILDDQYHFLPHPSVPSMAFAQEGRKAVVYQLAKNGRKYALKIFKSQYRDASMVGTSENLSQLAFRGLEACSRLCFTRPAYAGLINQFPDMEYAVLMPWINGSTWFDVVYQGTALTPDASKTIAKNTADVLANLEKGGYAHCDVAGANVIVNTLTGEVNFIDVEDMFGPRLPDPSAYPLGTDGYHHKDGRTRPKGQWCAAGDRFSAAVLFSEMLGWCDADVRERRDEEHYFSPAEMQDPSSSRYQRLLETLKGLSRTVADCFERAWKSATLEDCPSMAEWAKALEFPIITQWIPIVAPPSAAAVYNLSWGPPINIKVPTPPNIVFKSISSVPQTPKPFASPTSLLWQPCFGSDGYIVQESDDAFFTQLREFYRGAQTSCSIAQMNTPKYYRVCAFNSTGNSPWSTTIVVIKQ